MKLPLLHSDTAEYQITTNVPEASSHRRAVIHSMGALGSICGLVCVGVLVIRSTTDVQRMDSSTSISMMAHQGDLSKWGYFLRDQRALVSKWASGEKEEAAEVTIVVGNEASDADSIITALAYAYLKATLEKQSDGSRVYIPIIKCRKSELRLRQESLVILKHAGVDPNDLIHMDEYVFAPLMKRVDEMDPKLQIVLTDHNRADGLLKGKVVDRVVEIIDHHKDQGWHLGAKRTLAFDEHTGSASAASCCTLIAEKYLASTEGEYLLKDNNGAVASALLAVIVIDSFGLERSTDADKDIVGHLETLVPSISSRKYLQFKVLQHYKENPAFWSSATLEENLIYDFKQFTTDGLTCGIASTFLSLDNLKDKLMDIAGVRTLEEYIQDPRNPDSDSEVQSTVFMIMLKREPWHLAVASKVPGIAAFSKRFLTSEEASVLDLEQVGSNNLVHYYRQKNEKASRKQVGPVCQAMLHSFKLSGIQAK